MQERMITSTESKILDMNCEYLGVSTEQLMENAGRAVSDEIIARFGRGSTVVVFGGTGRNGGDGMVAARHLANSGFRVTYLLVGRESDIQDASVQRNWKILTSMSRTLTSKAISDSSLIGTVKCEVAVDALLGTGARGTVRPPVLHAIRALNSLKCFKIAVDIPSGLDSDTGEVLGEAVKANLTVTLHATKTGIAKASNYCGEVKVVDIGIPQEAELYAGPGNVAAVTKPRPFESHKGEFGRLLTVGGSETFTGAPALVALAALRTGVDLSVVAASEAAKEAISSFSPNLIVVKLKGEHLNPRNIQQITEQIKLADAVVLGPGLGTHQQTVQAVRKLLRILADHKKPVLLDADALKALGRVKGSLGLPAVLTPHAGEFEFIAGKKPPLNFDERIEEVRKIATVAEATVLLKGNVDIISNGTRSKLNRTGNPAMTVGGTGDVLSGIAGGLLAQGFGAFESAVAAAFINGLAGDIAFRSYGNHIVATDLIDLIPKIKKDPLGLTQDLQMRTESKHQRCRSDVIV